VEQLVDRVFSTISPELHQAVSRAMTEVRWAQLGIGSKSWDQREISEAARGWTGALPGISVISNRGTVSHLDVSGHKEWYDFLVSAGKYSECWFRLPDLELRMEYSPGTMVALNGRILRHEVVDWEGDRVCYAHWARPALLRSLSIDLPSWVTQSEFV